MERFATTGDVGRACNVPQEFVQYAVRTSGAKYVERVGYIRLYDEENISRIVTDLALERKGIIIDPTAVASSGLPVNDETLKLLEICAGALDMSVASLAERRKQALKCTAAAVQHLKAGGLENAKQAVRFALHVIEDGIFIRDGLPVAERGFQNRAGADTPPEAALAAD